MKILIKALFSSIILLLNLPPAFGDVICISEPAITINNEETKWIVSIFSPDGSELKKVAVNGVMARVSPDSKYIAYLEYNESKKWELAISGINGDKIKTFPVFSHKSQRTIFSPAKLVWSPDGEKIAILLHSRSVFVSKAIHGHPVLLGVVNLKMNKIKSVFSCYAETSDEAYSYTVQWFPDSIRILFAGADGTRIINFESKTSQEIAKDSFVAHLTGDGNRVIYISGYRSGKGPVEIWRYDLEKMSALKLMSLSTYPPIKVFSDDGRYLVYQNFPIKEPALFIVDLLSNNVEKIDTEEMLLVPVQFSPHNNHLIFCLGGKELLEHGIYNIDSREFHHLKPISNPENAMLLIIGSDWVDWR